MKYTIEKYSEMLNDGRMDAEFHIKKIRILKKYRRFIGQHRKKEFLKVVEIKTPSEIKKGDLVFKNRGMSFTLEIAEEDIDNSRRRDFVFKIKDPSFSKQYILWYFNRKEIKDYLSLYAKGQVIIYIPVQVFEKLEIIKPRKIEHNLNAVNISINSRFGKIVKKYLNEYTSNIKNENYLSASFLVGAICESILYQYLIDKGVDEKHLERKTYGQLIEIIEIANFNIDNLDDFKKIQDFRNNIHPNRALNHMDTLENMEQEIEPTFNRIIENFGI